MKRICLILALMPLFMTSQIDTTYTGNRRNTYRMIISPIYKDTIYELLTTAKIYSDPWVPAFDALFLADWASAFFIFPSMELHKDKWYHMGAGMLIGAGTNLLVYKKTKKKWLAFGCGVLGSAIVGGAKELIDPYIGGARTWQDFGATVLGGLNGSVTVLIPIGHIELRKKKYKELGIN